MLPSNRITELPKARDLFESFFTSGFPIFTDNNSIKVAVSEETDHYSVEAEIPGVQKEDIQLEFENEQLHIRAIKNEKTDIKRENYIYKEISKGTVARTIYLPNATQDNAEAKYENGILKLKILKKERDEQYKKNRIEIQ